MVIEVRLPRVVLVPASDPPCPKGDLAPAFVGAGFSLEADSRPYPRAYPEEANQAVPQSPSSDQSSAPRTPTSAPTSGLCRRCSSSTRRTPPVSARVVGLLQGPGGGDERRPSSPPARRARRPPRAGGSSRGCEGPPRPRPRRPRRAPKAAAPRRSHAGPAPVAKPRPAAPAAEPARARHPGRQGPEPAAPAAANDQPTFTVLRGAPARTAQNMDVVADRPHRHVGALPARQAAVGQPHGHQQPPRPGPWRQGLLHPPHRLRAGEGAQVDAGDERRFRHRRRQAQPDHPRSHQPRPGDRRTQEGRQPSAARAGIKAAESMDFAGFWTAYEESSPRPATTSSPSPTSRAPASR